MRLALVVIVLAACGRSTSSSVAPAAPIPVTKPAKEAAAAQPKAPTFAGVPETPAGIELAWVLDVIVHKQGSVTAEEVEARFDKKFLAQVPADKMVALFSTLGRQLASLSVVAVKGDDTQLAARIEAGGEKLQVMLALDPGSRRIVGLLLRPDAEAAPKPKTFEEALTATAALAPRAQLLVAQLDKGVCKPLHQTGPKEALAIGSTFKLYVLLGLVDRILARKATWDDEIAVRDEWKSLPSGTTQNVAAGTKLSLRELATRMISISDNTATDHLLHTVGRPAIETAMRSTKHSNPKLNTPFISTREMFVLKLELPKKELDEYLTLTEPKRRAFLDAQVASKTPDVAKAEGWTTARLIEELEWFANADDLCRAMGALWQRAQKPTGKDLLAVLGKNPGVAIDEARWPYVGFKGGSEPGVVNLTWLLKRSDDKWFVVTLTANARDGVVDASKAAALGAGVIELLGAAK